MAINQIMTIGVYGYSPDRFFDALENAGVDTLCDIRQRRAVRGEEYAFANSARLQARLDEMGIRYIHERQLAPTTEIRKSQYEIDKSLHVGKRNRAELSEQFVKAFRDQILSPFDMAAFISQLPTDTRVLAFFCVERAPEACHRYLVADAVARECAVNVAHLMP